MWTVYEYLYRDSGNFKAFGCVALKGRIDDADREAIRLKLDSGEFFIAEQVGVPPLYEQLYRWSNGPTLSDHCWHEFIGVRESDFRPAECTDGGDASEFVKHFNSVSEWDLSLSPHFELV